MKRWALCQHRIVSALAISTLVACAGARIAESAGKGLGAFAARRIAVHERVGDYTGEWLSQRDIDARYGPNARSSELWTAKDAAWAAQREENGIGCTGNYIFQVLTHVPSFRGFHPRHLAMLVGSSFSWGHPQTRSPCELCSAPARLAGG